ncbi:hypothetical protein ScPMuIL_011411 [Solemya velum]
MLQGSLSEAGIAKSVLGKNGSCKCVLDGKKAVFIRDLAVLLNSLDIEHPVGQYVLTVCQAFHKKYGFGVETLLTVTGLLTQAALDLKLQGIPLPVVIRLIGHYLELCILESENLKIPLNLLNKNIDEEFSSTKYSDESTRSRSFVLDESQNNIDTQTVFGLTHSRLNNEDFSISPVHQGTGRSSPTYNTIPSKYETLSYQNIEDKEIDDTSWYFNSDSGSVDQLHLKIERITFINKEIDNCLKGSSSSYCDGKVEFDCGVLKESSSLRNSFQYKYQSQNNEYSGSSLITLEDEDEFESCFNDLALNTPLEEYYVNSTQHSRLCQYVVRGATYNCSCQQNQPGTRENELLCLSEKSCDEAELGCPIRDEQRISKHSSHKTQACDLEIEKPSLDLCHHGRYAGNSSIETHKNFDGVQEPNNQSGDVNSDSIHTIDNQKFKGEDRIEQLSSTFPVNQNKAVNCSDRLFAGGHKSCKHEQTLDLFSDIYKNKRPGSTKSILNQSRHFKTIVSSIEQSSEYQGSLSHDQTGTQTSSSTKEIEDIQGGDDSINIAVAESTTGLEITSVEQLPVIQNKHNPKNCNLSNDGLSKDKIISGIRNVEHLINSSTKSHQTYFSRHFADNLSQSDDKNKEHSSLMDYGSQVQGEKLSTCTPKEQNKELLDTLTTGLNHGASIMMEFVFQAAEMQKKSPKNFRFSPRRLHCCRVGSTPFDQTVLVDGTVLSVHSDYIPLIEMTEYKQHRALLVNADIKPEHKHIGYKKPTNIQTIHTARQFPNLVMMQTKWVKSITDILKKFEVSVILCHGTVCEEMQHLCDALGIVVLVDVPYRALTAISFATHTELTAYVTEAVQSNVCEGLRMSLWSTERKMNTGEQFVVLTCQSNIMETLVLCSPSSGLSDIMEQEFWQCTSRLSSALMDDCVLPGEGLVEKHCADFCRMHADICLGSETDNMFRPAVADKLAEVFQEYYSRVSSNCDKWSECGLGSPVVNNNVFQGFACENIIGELIEELTGKVSEISQSNPPVYETESSNHVFPIRPVEVYDNYSSKKEAWRLALETTAFVLQTDACILTGVERSSTGNDNPIVL